MADDSDSDEEFVISFLLLTAASIQLVQVQFTNASVA